MLLYFNPMENKEQKYRAEPFRIKMVEPVKFTTEEERRKIIKKAHYNPFFLRTEDVYIDLLTDSGTGAMSNRQWSSLMLGDEGYAGSDSFSKMKSAINDIMGLEYVLPVHQGRAAENVLFTTLLKEGDIVPGNAHFDTTKAHIEYHKATAIDCTIDEGHNPNSEFLFKGNVDLDRLESLIKKYGKEKIPIFILTITCNANGGQPVSMQNIKDVSNLLKKYDIPLFFDAARFAENAYFIKIREKGYSNKSVKEIVREMFSYVDGCTMSAKKDAIVNIGGFIALRDSKLYDKLAPYVILFEGFLTYGGMSGRDIECIAQGLYDGIDEDYLKYRINQTKYLGKSLQDAGIPVVVPFGGHAIYVDALNFLPHIPQEEFPAHSLTIELYIEAGVRAVEIGTILAGRDPVTKKNRPPALELMRLAIPRRVYTNSHLDVVVEALIEIYKRRNKLKGYRFTFEPPILRHFSAHFEPIP